MIILFKFKQEFVIYIYKDERVDAKEKTAGQRKS